MYGEMRAWREGGIDGEEWAEEAVMDGLVEGGLDTLLVSPLPDWADPHNRWFALS